MYVTLGYLIMAEMGFLKNQFLANKAGYFYKKLNKGLFKILPINICPHVKTYVEIIAQ